MTLGQIARILGVELEGDPDRVVTGVAALDTAGPEEISFVSDRRFLTRARKSRAAGFLVSHDVTDLPAPLLRAKHPRMALIDLLYLFHPMATPSGGIHTSAHVAPSAQIHPTATVGALAFIGEQAVVGERAWIHPYVYVGAHAEIGAHCLVYPHVVIGERVKLGNRVIVHPGAVLGADGFGYTSDGTHHRKIPQVGIVSVEDDVEIGANVTVDRATLGQTAIGRGTKIDNLVQIGHNVKIGEDAILVAQVGISGSCQLGDRTILAGQVGIVDHVTLADGVIVEAQSGVLSDLKEAGTYLGYPARPAPASRRMFAALPKLPELLKRVRELERRVLELEGRLESGAPSEKDGD